MRNPCSLFSFDAGACAQQVVGGWIAAIPLDLLLGAFFLLGLALGAVLGRWGALLLVVALALGKLFLGRPGAASEEIYPHPDEQRRKRLELPDLFGRLRGKRGRQQVPDFRDWIEGEE